MMALVETHTETRRSFLRTLLFRFHDTNQRPMLKYDNLSGNCLAVIENEKISAPYKNKVVFTL